MNNTPNKKPFRIAVAGCGVVGSGVADILIEQGERLSKQLGREVSLKRILDIRDFTGTKYEPYATVESEDILGDPEISAVVVTIGGLGFAASLCRRALQAGKHVITSNKEVVAEFGRDLTRTAYESGVRFLYEASSGGGIPVIRPLNICLKANEITGIRGILNGTTNYIITRMEEDGIPFGKALKEAQTLGYAEADPSADIDGADAARKIAILSTVAFDEFISYHDVSCRGIRDIRPCDIELAALTGHRIKLIAESVRLPEGISASVEPMLVGPDNLLFSVRDVYNGILISGNYIDHTFFFGQGAGKRATASAVCGDIIEILRSNTEAALPGFVNNDAKLIKFPGESKYYLRFSGIDSEADAKAAEDLGFILSDNYPECAAVIVAARNAEDLESKAAAFSAKLGMSPELCMKVLE
ncbi:MAG: homoserine dehydrogenase [Clostridia bacterium]|nr:homoserine dehydrogenase [Clostridia bacterium]